MFVATLVISGRDWLWPAAIFLALALLALGWTYRHAPAGGAIRGVCVFLKLLGLLVLAACLVDPLWSGQRARPGANIFVGCGQPQFFWLSRCWLWVGRIAMRRRAALGDT